LSYQIRKVLIDFAWDFFEIPDLPGRNHYSTLMTHKKNTYEVY